MPSAWQAHLTAYRAAHPRCNLKTCMQEASKTYRGSSAKARGTTIDRSLAASDADAIGEFAIEIERHRNSGVIVVRGKKQGFVEAYATVHPAQLTFKNENGKVLHRVDGIGPDAVATLAIYLFNEGWTPLNLSAFPVQIADVFLARRLEQIKNEDRGLSWRGREQEQGS